MGMVDDLESWLTSISEKRPLSDWRDLVNLTAPHMSRGFDWVYQARSSLPQNAIRNNQRSRTSERSSKIYDDTAVWLVERLKSGVESLVSPQSAKWHGLGFDDAFASEPTQEEDEWLDLLTNYLFAARYEARSGFALANKAHIGSNVALGTGIYYIEENPDPLNTKRPFFYRPIPLYQANIGCDYKGEDEAFFWEFPLTAEQAMKRYDGKVSQKLRECAENPKRKGDVFWFVHAVVPRDNGKYGAETIQRSLFESIHYERESKHIVKSGGFYEWPFVISRWHRNGTDPYGIAQSTMMLGTIKTVNVMARDQLTASSQSVRPPLATHKHERAVDVNPGKVNPGLLDEQGRMLIQPIVTTGNPQISEATLERHRQALREGLFGTLWQVLLNETGDRTATEVMVRAQEKSDLIGPFAANVQAGYSRGVQREIAILDRRGAFHAGSPLEPPDSVAGKEIGIRYTAPIDKLRRYGDLEAIQLVRNEMLQTAQTHQEILDNLDADETWDAIMDIVDPPRRISYSPDERDKIRAEKAKQMQMAQQLQMAREGAAAAKDGAQALGGGQWPG